VKNPFSSLLEISENINSIHDTTILFDRIMDTAMETLAAERGFILLKLNGSAGAHEVVTARNMNRETISSLQNLSTSVVAQVLKQ
jgi:Nif-specific regulatory protein